MKITRVLALAAGVALLASPAFAHPGHGGSGLLAGIVHPFTGLDHLLAMVGVGLWAGQVFKRAWWVWPATFVGFMTAGFGLAMIGVALPAPEVVIAASVVALGLAIGFRLKLPAMAGCAAIAIFGVAHGYAHGQEIPKDAHGLDFALGFIAATLTLHAIGLSLSWLVSARGGQAFARAAGFGMAAAGVAMLLA
jgi:urease accessory protein